MAQGLKTGGRKKGSKNRLTDEAEIVAKRMRRALEKYDQIRQSTRTTLDQALEAGLFTGPPDAFLCHVYMDAAYPIDTRVRAATNVLPYLKPKLEAITHLLSNPGDNAREVNKLELARRVAYLLTSGKQVLELNAEQQTNNDQTNSNSAEQTVASDNDQQLTDRDRSEP